jgi:hypothetical protein
MSGDYTRFTFDTLRDYTRPRPQQGRVIVDADLNELSDAFDHRLRALALDVLGPCTAPVDQAAGPGAEATGFKIEPGGASFTIGLGRLYLHGLTLDNHGSAPWEIEPGLRDRRGTAPVPYEQQPYYPNPPAAPTSGEHVVYVDAWEREVTAVSDPTLVDPAVAVDTATRMQTVWQVKVLPADTPGVACDTPDEKLPGYVELTAPSAARLTVTAVGVPAPTDPCSVPADGGYRGWDNRLYRVEVHDGGTLATATFKWSRDNASVETAILQADSTRKILTVARTGRDDVQRIREGAWVEVQDDEHELDGQPGHLAQVVTVDAVDDMSQTVTLSTAVPAGFGTLGTARRSRLRQWDHTTAASTITTASTSGGLVLEDGVQIEFDEAVAGGPFRTGDFWTFAARSADASLQELEAAAPQGPIHFYGRLGIIGGTTTKDCRAIWPCECDGGCGGDCTECVTPESHASGQLTIQMAVDRLRRTGGTVCLAAGRYELAEPVVVERARGLTIKGHRWASLLEYGGAGPAIVVVASVGVQLLDLTVLLGVDIEPEPGPADVEDPRETTHLTSGMRDSFREDRTAWTRETAENIARERRTRDAKRSATPVAGIGLLHTGAVRIEGCVVVDVRLFEAVGALAGGALGSMSVAYQSPLSARFAVGFGQAAGIVTAGIVAGLAVRDTVLVAAIGMCGWHTQAASLRYAKTHQAMVSKLSATSYSLLTGLELTDDIVIGLRAGIWWDEAVLTSMAAVERSMIVGLLGFGIWWDAHPLDRQGSVRGCIVTGRWAAIASSASGLTIADCRLTASGTGASGAEAGRVLTNGDGVLLTSPTVEGRLTKVTIRGCTIRAARHGISSADDSTDVLAVDNTVAAGLGGIVQLPDASGERWVVRGNDVAVTGTGVPRDGKAVLAGIWLVQPTLGEVRENYVHDIGSATSQPTPRIGIGIEQCESAVIADNTVVGVIGGGRTSQATGIGAWPDVGRLDLIDNVVSVDGSAAIGAATDIVAFTPIRIDGRTENAFIDPKTGEFVAATVPSTQARMTRSAARKETSGSFISSTPAFLAHTPANYLRVGENLVRLTPQRVWQVVPSEAAVAARGNRIDTHGIRPAVYALVDGGLQVNDNVIRHAGNEEEQIRVAGIVASADSMVVNGNHVEVPSEDLQGVPTGFAMVLTVNPDRAAVTGNVVRGVIDVDGAALQPPWSTMNAILG